MGFIFFSEPWNEEEQKEWANEWTKRAEELFTYWEQDIYRKLRKDIGDTESDKRRDKVAANTSTGS